ncbi:Protein phosphatase 2C 2 [Linnemannia zychae]|nr:Protein phosphatase 2C 2 [Linnemannia zychae]
MGQTLSAPITEKHSSTDHDEHLAYGMSAMQGWRATMDDAHATLLRMKNANGTAFFAVYDGHGGNSVANYCGKHLHNFILADTAFEKGDFKTAIKNGILETDVHLHQDSECDSESSGCTAITATISNSNKLYVGNVGDSRAVLCSNGKAIALSTDHKPTNIDESTRIMFAGGYVESGRVNGLLATSRALGDFRFKTMDTTDPGDQIVTANPDIMEHVITEDDEFLVLACDGIWECMSSNQVIDFVRLRIAQKISLDSICEMTLDHCLAPPDHLTSIGCDNMTMIIVAFLNGKTVERWYDCISNRVASVGSNDLSNNIHSIPEKSQASMKEGNAIREKKSGKSVRILTRLFSKKRNTTSSEKK